MKHLACAWIAVLLSIAPMAVAENGFHVFMDDKGRAIEARIVSYDSVKDSLQLERRDGERFRVQPNLFSKDDQAYIREWVAAERVLSDGNLRVSLKKKKLESFKDKKLEDVNMFSKGEIVCYEITLSNRSKQSISGLRIESTYFVLFEGNTETLKRIGPGSKSVSVLEPGQSVTITTAKLTLEERFRRTQVTGPGLYSSNEVLETNETKVSKDNLKGIWLKIYGPEVDGDPVVRDVSDPGDLREKVEWNGGTEG